MKDEKKFKKEFKRFIEKHRRFNALQVLHPYDVDKLYNWIKFRITRTEKQGL